MNLSRKIVLVIVSTFIALVFIVAATSDLILLHSYRQIEKRNVLNHTQQARNLIKEREEQIDVTARDFSYGLAELLQNGLHPSFIEKHYFSEINLNIHRIDLAAMYDHAGRPVIIRSIDCG